MRGYQSQNQEFQHMALYILCLSPWKSIGTHALRHDLVTHRQQISIPLASQPIVVVVGNVSRVSIHLKFQVRLTHPSAAAPPS